MTHPEVDPTLYRVPDAGDAATAEGEPHPWWREAVVYQVYVRSFSDGDGDGVGDLPGVRARLPHIADLGVDAVWLTPFYRSPMADHGYDVADPRDVDPLFGTLEDADALIRSAHDLGIRVLVDIVPNHTSDQHVWFQQALRDGPGSAARARYVFRDGQGPDGAQPPNNWRSVFGGSAWTRVPDGQWYLHLFSREQPDLDWTHGDVGEEYESVLRFWLDRGVDGFRIDVAHGLAKQEGLPDTVHDAGMDLFSAPSGTDMPMWDVDDVHAVYRRWRTVLDSYPGDRMAVGEVWVPDYERFARYVRPDELHQAFNISMCFAPWDAAAFREVVDSTLSSHGAVGASPTWVLSNHDITRHRTRFGAGERLGAVDVGLRRAEAALLLMLALPGSAYLYQGEELGLPEVEVPPEDRQDPVWERSEHTEPGRDGCRIPLPWSGDAPPYGFGPFSGQPWLPQPDGWGAYAVERLLRQPGSTLVLYRRALWLRRELWLGSGPLEWLITSSPNVLSWRRARPGGGWAVCVVNLSQEDVALPAGELLLASVPASSTAGGRLPADSAAWLSWTEDLQA